MSDDSPMRPAARMSGDKISTSAKVIAGGLVIATIVTFVLFGAGIWSFLTVDSLPAREMTFWFRVTGIATCLVPIVQTIFIWVVLNWIGSQAPDETPTEGVQPRD